jgi:hypothetical protein
MMVRDHSLHQLPLQAYTHETATATETSMVTATTMTMTPTLMLMPMLMPTTAHWQQQQG